MEPKAKSFGDLITAEGSSLLMTTLSGSAANCINLVKLYLFLLTTEKGIRMCWNGDLKKEKIQAPDGNKMIEVFEEVIHSATYGSVLQKKVVRVKGTVEERMEQINIILCQRT
jgi:hypothetical protein